MKKSVQITILLLSISISSFAQTVDLQKGLVAYYPFNGNANDESGNGNNGTIHGARLTTDRNGNSNSAYSFDGKNDYMEIPSTKNIKISGNEITISTWVKIKGNGINWGRIFLGGQVNKTYTLTKHKGNNKILWRPIIENKGTTYAETISKKSLTKYEWYHIVAIYDKGSTKLYINGILNSSSSSRAGNLAINNKTNLIGGETESHEGRGNRSAFHGEIDDTRIYSRAIKGTEIQALYNKKSVVLSESDKKENQIFEKAKNGSLQDCKVIDTDINSSYEGECKEGFADGFGTAKGRDTYIGGFKKGLTHGKGKYLWANGDKFQGNYKNGKKNGEGHYTWADGGYFLGNFYNGKKHGYGRYVGANGYGFTGQYQNGSRKSGSYTVSKDALLNDIGDFMKSFETSINEASRRSSSNYTWSWDDEKWSNTIDNHLSRDFIIKQGDEEYTADAEYYKSGSIYYITLNCNHSRESYKLYDKRLKQDNIVASNMLIASDVTSFNQALNLAIEYWIKNHVLN